MLNTGTVSVSQYREKTVGEIMRPLETLSAVSARTTIGDAVYLLCHNLASQGEAMPYLLVFDHKKLVGLVGAEQLLAAADPPGLKNDWYRGWNVTNWCEPDFLEGIFAHRCLEAAGKQVGDVMQPLREGLKPGDSLAKAVYSFLRRKTDLLPVQKNGQVVGVVRRLDVLYEMGKLLGG
ncbi:MAG: CBS domain-containing protein [Desulfurispora sp.]|uniref:CBS domain-containing protein n=1 Tax=Desulfurispora sp. TaxID=3014275 RepID=UPI004049F276